VMIKTVVRFYRKSAVKSAATKPHTACFFCVGITAFCPTHRFNTKLARVSQKLAQVSQDFHQHTVK